MQVSRDDLRLHLSEHHGDGSPGVHIHVEMTGVDDFHREVTAKGYRYLRPGVQDEFYGARAMHVIDPFGNRITFNEFKSVRRRMALDECLCNHASCMNARCARRRRGRRESITSCE